MQSGVPPNRGPGPLARLRRLAPTALALALFAVLTGWMTWPLPLQMSTHIPGWVGDNWAFLWMVGWFQRALFNLGTSPLVAPTLNYPEGFELAHNDIPYTMIFTALPVSQVGNPVLGYNLAMLLSFVLSGLGMYLWVRRSTRSVPAGILAGTTFAFLPYRMAHLTGHLNLMGTQWFPFYFMNLFDLLEGRGRAQRTVGLTCVFLALIGFTSQYYLYMTLVLTTACAAGYALLLNRRAIRSRRFWRRLSAFVLISLPVVLLCITPYLLLATKTPLTHTFLDVVFWSASPTDYILPSPQHLLFGRWLAAALPQRLWVESSLYMGVVPIGLAAAALLGRPGSVSTCGGRDERWLPFIGAAAAFALSLGVSLYWLGWPIIVDVPAFLRRWNPDPKTFVLLPGYLLYKFLPFYAGMRVWMRYGVFVNLFLAMLAGIGLAGLLEGRSRWFRLLVSTGALLLVLVDFYPGTRWLVKVEGRPVDAWLAAQPGQGAVAQFPIEQSKGSAQGYYTLVHNKPFIGDPFLAFKTPQWQRIKPVLSSFPDQASVTLLHELGVQWIVVDSSSYVDFAATQAEIEALGLLFRVELDGYCVYELE